MRATVGLFRCLGRLAVLAISVWAVAHPAELGPAPVATDIPARVSFSAGSSGVASGIDPWDRQQVAARYREVFDPTVPAANWSGSIAACSAGDTAQAYKDATLERINYYREMAQLPPILGLREDWTSGCQETALMMIAEGRLSHTPSLPWRCYTASGAATAGQSNLSLGAAGPIAVDAYMRDQGGGNEIVGHRRWLLYPPQREMGSGSTTERNGQYVGSNALRVIQSWGPRPTTPEWVAWPPPGFVPQQVAFPRWSFSMYQANFSNATVAMVHKGSAVVLQVVARDSRFIGDPVIVWEPQGVPIVPPEEEMRYQVAITGVVVNNTPRDFAYEVVLFDPHQTPPSTFTPPPPPTATPTIAPRLDLNDNDRADAGDLFVWSVCWSAAVGSSRYDARCDWNGDGHIDADDLRVMIGVWLQRQ